MQQEINTPNGLSGKTSSEHLAVETVTTLRQSLPKWQNWGRITLNGQSSMRNTSESPNTDDESLSWPVFTLQDVNTVPSKYFLSPKAAAGILRRAYDSTIPQVVTDILESVANGTIHRIESVHPFIVDGTRVSNVRVYDYIYPTLKARMGTGGNNVPLVTQVDVNGVGRIRKLTPSEVEMVMGWPMGHTLLRMDGSVVSDTQRYKMCGNGVVSPVAAWIARQIDNA